MYKRLGLLLVLVLLAQGCTVYNSRYYYQDPPRPQCTAGVCITPRIFAYQNQHGDSLEWKAIDSFQVSFRITDTTYHPSDEELRKAPDERRAEAAAYQQRVFSSFKVDSLVFQNRDKAMGRLQADLPDTTRYVPQAANYLTVHFGYIHIADTVTGLRAVLHLTRLDPRVSSLSDSVVFDLIREEYHDKGVQMLRDNVRGYED